MREITPQSTLYSIDDCSFFEMIICYYRIYVTLQIQMNKRVTIIIDDDLDKKLRISQAKIIQQDQSSCSYSRIVNDTLRKALK